MNFHQYWELEEKNNLINHPIPFLPCEKQAAEKAWDTCKNEVIKIIQEIKYLYCGSNSFDISDYSLIIEKIEKL